MSSLSVTDVIADQKNTNNTAEVVSTQNMIYKTNDIFGVITGKQLLMISDHLKILLSLKTLKKNGRRK